VVERRQQDLLRSRFAHMKKISSGTLNQKLKRETTNATIEARKSV